MVKITHKKTAQIKIAILYTLPAWGVFLDAGQPGRIDAILKRAYKCGSTKNLITVTKLLTQSSTTFFRKIKQSISLSKHSLTAKEICQLAYSLRNCDFNYRLPRCSYTNHKHSFINHCLSRVAR